MKSVIEISIESADGQTWMVLETDIPVRLNGGDGLAVCGCCDPLKIDGDSSPPVWDMKKQAMRYTCWYKYAFEKMDLAVEHFAKCGFMECKSSREMFAADENARRQPPR